MALRFKDYTFNSSGHIKNNIKMNQKSEAFLAASGLNGQVNPSNAEATFIQSTMMQRFLKNI